MIALPVGDRSVGNERAGCNSRIVDYVAFPRALGIQCGAGTTRVICRRISSASVQNPIWIALVLVLIGDILLRKSRFFRQNYYLGGNERAAFLSGIRVERLKIFNYALTGMLAAVAGIIMTARLGTASVTAGTGLELAVISAVIIGGASLKGGEGTVLGSFLGSLLMGILVGALTLLGVDVYWNTLVIGATLLIAVLIDNLGRRRRSLQ